MRVSYICVRCVAVVNVLPLNACVCVIVQSEHVEIEGVVCGWIGKQAIAAVMEKRGKETKEQGERQERERGRKEIKMETFQLRHWRRVTVTLY